MMNRVLSTTLLLFAIAVPAAAQQGAPQGPPTVTGFLRNLYNGNKNSVLRVAERMPEESYGLRPGTQEEVRTFGQHVAHIATYNYLWCSQAKGEANPNAGRDLEKTLKAKGRDHQGRHRRVCLLRPGICGAHRCVGSRGHHDHAGERTPAATDPRRPPDAERRPQQRDVRQHGDDAPHQEHLTTGKPLARPVTRHIGATALARLSWAPGVAVICNSAIKRFCLSCAGSAQYCHSKNVSRPRRHS